MALDSLPPIVPAFELSGANQGMSKGVLQSDGAQFIPRASLKLRKVQVGGQWKNISTNSAKGEASIFGGWAGKVSTLDVGGLIAYKMLTSASGSGNRQSWEVSANAARRFGRLGIRASAVFSPNDFGGTRRSLYVEAGPSLDLPWKFRASASVGIRERRNNSDYTSFNLGLSRPLGKKFTVDVRYYDTNRGDLGETFDNRLVGSIKLSL